MKCLERSPACSSLSARCQSWPARSCSLSAPHILHRGSSRALHRFPSTVHQPRRSVRLQHKVLLPESFEGLSSCDSPRLSQDLLQGMGGDTPKQTEKSKARTERPGLASASNCCCQLRGVATWTTATTWATGTATAAAAIIVVGRRPSGAGCLFHRHWRTFSAVEVRLAFLV